jgi:hypothetical protein
MRVRGFLLLPLLITCGSSQKPFDQLTAEEHRAAAEREQQLADDNFDKITGWDVTPGDLGPTDIYSGWALPYSDDFDSELGDPESYTAWPRVYDPSEKYEDRASKHRERALAHERAAAALEGRPSPQPLPPDREDQLLPDQT